jgi:hypothetical protein
VPKPTRKKFDAQIYNRQNMAIQALPKANNG